MTVYRRRLTSSFQAIERSLRRRLEVLRGNIDPGGLLDFDDIAAVEYSTVLDDNGLEGSALDLAEEIGALREFLDDLAECPPDESKMSYLHQELNDAFTGRHDTALVFTQYTDTMEYLRDRLVMFYGPKLICYSAAGGQRWDPRLGHWTTLNKQEVKTLFREGKDVKILIGTDSLSEGLNLQTCAKVINYDMPWNFMRVEQRIGRVDRINGQPLVDVSN